MRKVLYVDIISMLILSESLITSVYGMSGTASVVCSIPTEYHDNDKGNGIYTPLQKFCVCQST